MWSPWSGNENKKQKILPTPGGLKRKNCLDLTCNKYPPIDENYDEFWIKVSSLSTSGNYSFNFKKNLAFGYIDNNISNNELNKKNLFIEVEKKKYLIEFIKKPLKQTNFKNN